MKKLPKAGGDPVVLRSSTTSIPIAIAVDANNVYWSEAGGGPDGGSINSLPVSSDGGTPTLLTGGGALSLACRAPRFALPKKWSAACR